MTKDYCIENDFAAQKEIAHRERHEYYLRESENENLRAELEYAITRVKALEEALQKARDVSSAALTRVDKLRAENKALKATCTK